MSSPKTPAPDAYLKALELLADPGDRIIGFEDSLRGVQSFFKQLLHFLSSFAQKTTRSFKAAH